MRTWVILGGALALAGASAASAQPQAGAEPGGLWQAARACADSADRLACWRRVADTWPPKIQVAEAAGEGAEPPAEIAPLIAASEAFHDRVARTAEALASGVEPSAALQTLETLPVLDPPFAPDVLSDASIAFGRLDAYAIVAAIVREQGLSEAHRAVLAAWEAALPADSADVADSGASDLAWAFADLGDGPAVERVLATLEPENGPAAVIDLIRHGRLDAAATVAGRMTVAAREAGLRREADIALQRHRTHVLPITQAAMGQAIESMLDELPASERPRAAAMLNDSLNVDESALAADLGAEDWRGRAKDEVADARASLLRAADAAGRTDIARPLALALWDQPVETGWTGADGLIVALPILARPDAPDAAKLLAEAEGRLMSRDRRLFPLKALYDGWIRIGRRDQADALLRRWRGLAGREPLGEMNTIGRDLAEILIARDEAEAAERLPAFNALMLLRHDREAGVGAARLAERIAGRDYETQRSMLMDCGGAVIHGDLDMAEACVRRRMAFDPISPLERWSIAQSLVDLGGGHARRDDRSRAEALVAEGFAFSPGPPEAFVASDMAVDAALESVTGPRPEADGQGRMP